MANFELHSQPFKSTFQVNINSTDISIIDSKFESIESIVVIIEHIAGGFLYVGVSRLPMSTRTTSTASMLDSQDEESVTKTVVSAVADAEGTSLLEIPPLADVIDPDALNALFYNGGRNTAIEFAYHGYQVHVHGGEQITVTVLGGAPPRSTPSQSDGFGC